MTEGMRLIGPLGGDVTWKRETPHEPRRRSGPLPRQSPSDMSKQISDPPLGRPVQTHPASAMYIDLKQLFR